MPEKEIAAGFLPRYRVLDLADEKGTYCGKLLGDLGSDVIKVEPREETERGPEVHSTRMRFIQRRA